MTTADPGFALPSGFEPLAEHGRVLEVVLTALEQVEEQLDSALGFDDLFSDTAAHHLLAAGGKRVRPLFAVAAAASRYCGIANGVSGAFAVLSGFVAIHASTAGLNSLRKRSK